VDCFEGAGEASEAQPRRGVYRRECTAACLQKHARSPTVRTSDHPMTEAQQETLGDE
jgi:hypothetical protein